MSSKAPAMETLANLADRDRFLAVVGPIYEKSLWIAERAFDRAAPFESLTAIDEAMWAVVCGASDEEQLGLLNAHPDLAGNAALAGDLTPESSEEQRCAGLGSLTPEEATRFKELNTAYRRKFGFPFIYAVRATAKRTILCAFTQRLNNSVGMEQVACLAQVRKIAWMRLRLVVQPAPTGFLTCHVLDTTRGCPAVGMAITLRFFGSSDAVDACGDGTVVGEFITNSDGRLEGGSALKGEAFKEGMYEWTFCVGEYFAAAGVPTASTPFLGDVPLRFGIDNPEQHYHVPLLCSPWSFSTYRGS